MHRCYTQTTLCHDILTGILCHAMHWAGIASTLEPPLQRLPCLTNGPGTSTNGSPSHPDAQGDILLAMPQGIYIAHVSVARPLFINSLLATAASAGAASARQDHQNRSAYVVVEPNGYAFKVKFKFVPFSVELYGCIGQPAMKLKNEAASPGGVTRASFVAGTLCKLSVGLCRGNFLMHHVRGGILARVSGRGFRAGWTHGRSHRIVEALPSCLFDVFDFDGPCVQNGCEPCVGVGCLAWSSVSCSNVYILCTVLTR
jgi:hypothetical protein